MKRLVIITVGKTHSGKTTFGRALEQEMPNSLVIDQDNHAEFINTYYKTLLPKQGHNTIKFAITQTIVDYAVNQTIFHLILCSSNRSSKGRSDLLAYFRDKGFICILVNFDLPDHILEERVCKSQRSTTIFRSASSFEEVLIRQQAESRNGEVTPPLEREADHFFVIKNTDEVQDVIQAIVDIAQSQ
ncbi:CRISPR-associated protein Cas2 [Paenibacillus sp. J23TS9]|uniref:AAA family ATPase n=1 Tax=Paenibacillus sp. J23TS9 TaxID=2807193 RepID=UPI001B2F6C1F|nr:AAA family ATPase [Paenibacillus sp. J23TS9]GIP29370.1 CRISPR-associated protein Cas2 [Paenibacillus sp. J23TS9]